MIQKLISFIELWIGLGFFIILVGYIPVAGAGISRVLGSLMLIAAQIPYYSIIIALFGTALFIDGIVKLFMR